MKQRANLRPVTPDRDLFVVVQLAASVSIASFFYYLQHNDLLLYGDAVAHINIARRVFDSRTPGLLQLGTVWLPLPHLLMIPFLFSKFLWQTGIGGTIPSMVAYVLSVVGVFRLVKAVIPTLPKIGEGRSTHTGSGIRFAAWLATGIFALNPNLIYLQATAMTEPVYLAFSIWAVVFFSDAIGKCRSGEAEKGNSALIYSGLSLSGACLTRYDGWLLAAVMGVLIVILAWAGKFQALRPGARKFVLLAVAAPALWIAYNAVVYRNPVEFANGPYSAKAIEQKTAVPGMPAHPGDRALRMAFKYFLKAAELNMAPGALEILWVAALLFGTAVVVLFQRKLWPTLLLWLPVPFYMLSIAHSGVPLFVPVWWPYSYYNVRYGIELLPAFAVFAATGAYGLMRFAEDAKVRAGVIALFLAMATVSYALEWRSTPVSLEEARVNSRGRVLLERQLAAIFDIMPENATVLMYLGDHVGAWERSGVSLSHTINEGNHRPWMKPTDPDGLWERALAHPAAYADFVIAFDSDPVARAVNKSELQATTVLHVSGQPEAILYRTLKSNQPR